MCIECSYEKTESKRQKVHKAIDLVLSQISGDAAFIPLSEKCGSGEQAFYGHKSNLLGGRKRYEHFLEDGVFSVEIRPVYKEPGARIKGTFDLNLFNSPCDTDISVAKKVNARIQELTQMYGLTARHDVFEIEETVPLENLQAGIYRIMCAQRDFTLH